MPDQSQDKLTHRAELVRGVLGDLLIVGGLASIGTGLWWWMPWVSLVVVGAIALGLGVFAQLRGGRP